MTKEQLDALLSENPDIIIIDHKGRHGVYHFSDGEKGYVGQTKNGIAGRKKTGYSWKEDMAKAMREHPEEVNMVMLHDSLGSIEQADFWEKVEIARQDTLYPHGHNKTTGGHKGYIVVREPFVQLDLEGNYVRTWLNQTRAAEHLGVGQGHISENLAGKISHVKEHRFMLLTEYEALKDTENAV